MDIWYFNTFLVVGPLDDCLLARRLLKPITSHSDILLATDASKKPGWEPPPRQPIEKKATKEGEGGQKEGSEGHQRGLKTIMSTFVARHWARLFPAGEEGDAAIKRLPRSLWEGILHGCPLVAEPSGGETVTLRDAVKRLTAVFGTAGIGKEFALPRGILLIEDKSSSRTSKDLVPIAKALSPSSVLVYNLCNDWGNWLDTLMVFSCGSEATARIHKSISDLSTPGTTTGAAPDSLPVVDTFLPDHLWEFRQLVRPSGQFTLYSDKEDNLPPGYNWLVLGRMNYKAQVPEENKKLLEELMDLLGIPNK